MELRQHTVGPWAMNAYALICPDTRQSVLIDPGAEPDELHGLLDGSTPTAILVTHGHPDHIGALEEMRHKLKVPVMAHGGNQVISADRFIVDSERITVGHHRICVHHTPGHTRDQVCFRVENGTQALVGDTLFEDGPGKTWSVQDFKATINTLRKVVLAWPDDTICYPGHGPQFRLGNIRRAITGFVDKDHGRFYGDAQWRM